MNEQFSRLFPADDDARRAAIRYLPSVPAALAADAGAAGAVLHRFHAGDLAAEAQRVVEIVRAARERDPAASIAVLVASREHVALPAAQLRAGGFTLRGVDLERLRDRPAIRDLAALTRALLHAADRSAWLALLRAPWCGLTLAELEALLAGPRAICSICCDCARRRPIGRISLMGRPRRPACGWRACARHWRRPSLERNADGRCGSASSTAGCDSRLRRCIAATSTGSTRIASSTRWHCMMTRSGWSARLSGSSPSGCIRARRRSPVRSN